ncbi:MAG TPA: hypothetical protein VHR42_09785, partial [Clostridia bacterium]|nr:hypothetical protein [Clostridia bacterium]
MKKIIAVLSAAAILCLPGCVSKANGGSAKSQPVYGISSVPSAFIMSPQSESTAISSESSVGSAAAYAADGKIAVSSQSLKSSVPKFSDSSKISSSAAKQKEIVASSSAKSNSAGAGSQTIVSAISRVVSSTASQMTQKPAGDVKILFVGNSFFYVPDTPSQFSQILLNKGINAEIMQKTGGAYTLHHHLMDFKTGKYNKLIEKANIVILQEHFDQPDTVESIKEIGALFKPGTIFYLTITDSDKCQYRIDQLKAAGNIKPIASPLQKMLDNGFAYAKLATGDGHMNRFYGYIEACTIFSTIYSCPIENLPYDQINKETVKYIPGTDKQKSVKTALKSVTEAITVVNSLWFKA